ncbi:17075_t:CDS:1 [Acaulospora colombiana]|uniref:17075_t:CDS:1 n=1 Tax=Acaulospora colombiana TaxID=27376 RepID=A0ACA9KNL1_9GLOM|nr:17075_t:CDS:1 [Acaulospora colombiana]
MSINFELWQNPGVPDLTILEKLIEVTTAWFKKARELNIVLDIKDNNINQQSRLYNDIISRRAILSLRVKNYARDVESYMNSLSSGRINIGTIVQTLKSLLNDAEKNAENSNLLRVEFNVFKESFTQLYSNPQEITNARDEVRFPIKEITKILACSIVIFYLPSWSSIPIVRSISSMSLTNQREDSEKESVRPSKTDQSNNVIRQLSTSSTPPKTTEEPKLPHFLNIFLNYFKDENNHFSPGSGSLFTMINSYNNDKGTSKQGSEPTSQETTDTSNSPINSLLSAPESAVNNVKSGFLFGSIGSIVESFRNLDHVSLIKEKTFPITLFILIYLFYKKDQIITPTIAWAKDRLFCDKKELVHDDKMVEFTQCIDSIKNRLPAVDNNLSILTDFWKSQVEIISKNLDELKLLSVDMEVRLPSQLGDEIKRTWREIQNQCSVNHKNLNYIVTENSLLNLGVIINF